MDGSCLPADWDLDNLTDSQAAAIAIASELLKAATGYAYGPCLVTVRPCAPERGFPCSGPCGCSRVCRVRLPAPVTPGPDWGVVGVVIDGQPVPAGAWRVDEYTWLVFEDGTCPPACQRLDRAAGQPGTWTVTYWRGWPVPIGGQRAVAGLAVRIHRDCHDGDGCWVDPRVTQLTRAGVTYQLDTDSEQATAWLGIPAARGWLASVNPKALAAPLVFWSPEMGTVNTTTSTSTPMTLSVTPAAVRPGGTVTATVTGEAGSVLIEWGDGEATS